jgi:signal transduction histidine kinase
MQETKTPSIARRLTWMNVLVSFVALLVCSAAFITYDVNVYKEAVLRNLNIQTQMIGYNSVSALTFNDPQAAQNTLSPLSASPNILAAGLLTADGKLFARYAKAGIAVSIPPLPAGTEDLHWFTSQELMVIHPIVFQDKTVGFVYIRSDLQRLYARLRQYALIIIAALLASLLVAVLVSSGVRRAISEPIVTLAETARIVSRDKNYSVRATTSGARDELSILVSAFNEMLSQIQTREEALRRAHNELEQRVQDRTRQLVASNKELEAFSYSVSHDLRAPLEVINGFSYVLETDHGNRLDANGRECLKQVRTASQRMGELIEDLLNLSRVSSSAMQHEKVDLSAQANLIAEDLHRREPERRVDFVIAPKLAVRGDSRFLQIVLENLLRNSWKYTSRHAKAHIEFGVEERRGAHVYFVRDDGAGFDPRRAGRLFQPFQRLHSESEFSGNGVGLATVQRIIQKHGGQIWATAAPEKGATFFFTIGQAPEATTASQPQQSAIKS